MYRSRRKRTADRLGDFQSGGEGTAERVFSLCGQGGKKRKNGSGPHSQRRLDKRAFRGTGGTRRHVPGIRVGTGGRDSGWTSPFPELRIQRGIPGCGALFFRSRVSCESGHDCLERVCSRRVGSLFHACRDVRDHAGKHVRRAV